MGKKGRNKKRKRTEKIHHHKHWENKEDLEKSKDVTIECREKSMKYDNESHKRYISEAASSINTESTLGCETIENKEMGLSVTIEMMMEATCNSENRDKKLLTLKQHLPVAYDRSCLLLQDSNENQSQRNDQTEDVNGATNAALSLLQLAKHAFHKISKQKHNYKSSSLKQNQDWSPTPIQLQSWPILAAPPTTSPKRFNLVGISPTGSGKSLAYLIPAVLKGLLSHKNNALTSESKTAGIGKKNAITTLIITPTRELTIQVSKVATLVCKSANKLIQKQFTKRDKDETESEHKKKKKKRENSKSYSQEQTNSYQINLVCNSVSSIPIYGGVDKSDQIKQLLGIQVTSTKNRDLKIDSESNSRNHSVIVTATPGRLIDLMGLGDAKNDNDDNDTKGKEAKNGSNDNEISSLSSNKKICSLFQSTTMLIIDEADRMATQSDISKQVDVIITFLKNRTKEGQNEQELSVALFSATLPRRASAKIDEWVPKPRCIVKVNSLTVGKSDRNDNSKIMIVEGNENKATESTKNSETKLRSGEEINKHENDEQSSSSSKKSKHNQRGPLSLSVIPSHVEQILHVCANHKKPKKLMVTIKKIRDKEQSIKEKRRCKGLIIVFFGRVKTLHYIHQLMRKENLQSVELHSQMKQEKRESQLNLFRSGKCPMLLATDIAARGLHVNNVEYIINYDFPSSLEQYVHRCGRAGRNKVTNESNKSTTNQPAADVKGTLQPTVYSFFHRELAPMAKDVVELLRSCNAYVDPNLLSLIPEKDRPKQDSSSRAKRRRQNKKDTIEEDETMEDNQIHLDSDEDEFSAIQQNRIVLKRASHVSDAESDSDDEKSQY